MASGGVSWDDRQITVNLRSFDARADRAITARLKQALALVDIRLLDHFVVGFGPPVSLAARGWV